MEVQQLAENYWLFGIAALVIALVLMRLLFRERITLQGSMSFLAFLTLLGAMAVLVSLAPWNIPLWFQLNRLRLAVEMDCDNRVVSALGNPGAYSELLFKVAEASSRGPRLQPAFLGASGSLEKRLVALLTPSRRRLLERVGATAAAAGLIVLLFSVPHPQREGSLDQRSMAAHAGSIKN